MYRATDVLAKLARPVAAASQQAAPKALGAMAVQVSFRMNSAVEASRVASDAISQRLSKQLIAEFAAAKPAASAAAPTFVAAFGSMVAPAPTALPAPAAPVSARDALAAFSAVTVVASPAAAVAAESAVVASEAADFAFTSSSLIPESVSASQIALDVAAGRYELCAVPKKRVSLHVRRVRLAGHRAEKIRTLYKPYKTCLRCKKVVAPHFACAQPDCLGAPRI
jgi:ribosomal protein L32